MSESLSPFKQGLYHLVCAIRHLWKAIVAFVWSPFSIFFVLPLMVLSAGGCHGVFPPAPQPSAVAPALGDLTKLQAQLDAERVEDAKNKAFLAALLDSAKLANEGNPEGAAKEATAGEIGLAIDANGDVQADPQEAIASADRRRLYAEGKAEEARAASADVSKRLESAQADAAKKRAEADAQVKAISADLDTLKRLSADNEAAHQAEIAKLKSKAEEEKRSLLNRLFFGGGGAAILLGILCLTFLSSVPMVGVKLGWSLIVAGGSAIAFGIAIDWALEHPKTVVGTLAGLVGVIIALAHANHWHSQISQTNPTPSPTK
jgi:hypothetical protein